MFTVQFNSSFIKLNIFLENKRFLVYKNCDNLQTIKLYCGYLNLYYFKNHKFFCCVILFFIPKKVDQI